jgi:hypothetical protein
MKNDAERKKSSEYHDPAYHAGRQAPAENNVAIEPKICLLITNRFQHSPGPRWNYYMLNL